MAAERSTCKHCDLPIWYRTGVYISGWEHVGTMLADCRSTQAEPSNGAF